MTKRPVPKEVKPNSQVKSIVKNATEQALETAREASIKQHAHDATMNYHYENGSTKTTRVSSNRGK